MDELVDFFILTHTHCQYYTIVGFLLGSVYRQYMRTVVTKKRVYTPFLPHRHSCCKYLRHIRFHYF